MILSHAPGVHYLNEPFNVDYKEAVNPIKRCYQYLGPHTKESRRRQVLKYLRTYTGFMPHSLLMELSRVRSLHDLYVYSADKWFRISRRPLYKDPFMLFSLEWLCQQLDPHVIITVRHPAAFVASLKVKNWTFDFNHLAGQKNLMAQQRLGPFEKQVIQFAENPPADIVEQGILLWNCLYDRVRQYRQQYGDQWHIVRHEDLSTEPEREFRALCSYAELEYGKRLQDKLAESTQSSTKGRLTRDSASNVKNWKQRLAESEIERIRTGCESVWRDFYTDEDW